MHSRSTEPMVEDSYQGYVFRRTVNISDHGSAPIACDCHATHDPAAVGDRAASARVTSWAGGSCSMVEAVR